MRTRLVFFVILLLTGCRTGIVGTSGPDSGGQEDLPSCPGPTVEPPRVSGQLISVNHGPADVITGYDPWQNGTIRTVPADFILDANRSPRNRHVSLHGRHEALIVYENSLNESTLKETRSDENGCYEMKKPMGNAAVCVESKCYLVNGSDIRLNASALWGMTAKHTKKRKGFRLRIYDDADELPSDTCSETGFQTDELQLSQVGVDYWDGRRRSDEEYIELGNLSRENSTMASLAKMIGKSSKLRPAERVEADSHCTYGEPCTVVADYHRLLFVFKEPGDCPGTHTYAMECDPECSSHSQERLLEYLLAR